MRNRALTIVALTAGLLTAGCGSLLQTPYAAPKVEMPAHWAESAEAAAMPAATWWKNFDDTALDALVARALARNNDLAAATIKVRRAQLEAGLAADQLTPTLGASGDAGVSRNLKGDVSTTRSYSVSGNVSWELDLWGRLGDELNAARWEARATEEDLAGTALSLVGTTVDLYWQIVYLTQRIAISEQSVAYAQRTLDLARVRHRSGAVSQLDVLEAEQSLEAQAAEQTQLVQQRVEAVNALAILFDGPPKDIPIARSLLPNGPLPPVAAGLPADLLGRRPDLKAAELRLRKTLATVDATRTSYLPRLTLTGSLGGSSIALVDVLKNPIGTLGAGLTLPFLNWNEMRLNVKVSQADYETAVIDFRQTLYAALRDVENALSARRQYAAQAVRLEKSLAAAREVERLYENRYRAGAVDLQSWLDAQQKRRTAEVSLIENRYNRLLNQVTLYQAFGGDTVLPAAADLAEGKAK